MLLRLEVIVYIVSEQDSNYHITLYFHAIQAAVVKWLSALSLVLRLRVQFLVASVYF